MFKESILQAIKGLRGVTLEVKKEDWPVASVIPSDEVLDALSDEVLSGVAVGYMTAGILRVLREQKSTDRPFDAEKFLTYRRGQRTRTVGTKLVDRFIREVANDLAKFPQILAKYGVEAPPKGKKSENEDAWDAYYEAVANVQAFADKASVRREKFMAEKAQKQAELADL